MSPIEKELQILPTVGLARHERRSSTDPMNDIDKAEIEVVEDEDNVEKPKELDMTNMRSPYDDLTLWQAAWKLRRVAAICLFAGFTAITDGWFNQIGGVIYNMNGFLHDFGVYNKTKKTYSFPAIQVSALSGGTSIGQVIGQLTIPLVSDKFGRKPAVFFFIFWIVITSIVEITAKEWWSFMIARITGAYAIGSMQVVLSVYINELAPARLRGFLLVVYNLWNGVGGLLATIALTVMEKKDNTMHWRPLVYSQFGTAALGALMFFPLPETPWWLVRHGKIDQAKKVLKQCYKGVEGYNVEFELLVMQATIEQEAEDEREHKREGHLAIFRGTNLKRFCIGLWPKLMQIFVGLTMYNTYATYLFKTSGASDPFLSTFLLTLLGLCAVPADAYFVERLGRRPMLLLGFGGINLGVTLIAILGMFHTTDKGIAAGLLFAGMLANFCSTFQVTTSYAVLTEVHEVRHRARGAGWGLAVINTIGKAFTFATPLMIAKWQYRTAWFYVILGIPGTIFTYFIMPETAGRSPAEINEMFENKIPLRKWKSHKTTIQQNRDAGSA